MADEKLNTGPGEEKLPEAPAPVTVDEPQAPAPEQTAAPTPQQEGPAQPEPGDVVGKAVFTVEALSLGGGYIIEPCYVDIIEGENAAQALARLLEEKGFTYDNTGSLESGFYLSHIPGDALADIDPTGDSIPQTLREKLEEKGFDIQPRTDETSLGEFDYTSGSGWMYSVNGVWPDYGCSCYTLHDGDTVVWSYTCDLGRDVGARQGEP